MGEERRGGSKRKKNELVVKVRLVGEERRSRSRLRRE